MLRIISANLNGAHSAASRSFSDRMGKQDADFICVQKLKCTQGDMTSELLVPHGYHDALQHVVKEGCSGMGLYTRHKPNKIITDFDNGESDAEDRYAEARYGKLSVILVYVPPSSSGEERQQAKFCFVDLLVEYPKNLRHEKGREVVLCGDVNIVHKGTDIKDWKGNQKNSGCLPEECAWLIKFFDEIGYVDVFHTLDQRPKQYMWWSNRGQAYTKNVGWRIDYQIAMPSIVATARRVSIFKDIESSDHVPLMIDYDTKPHW